MSIILQVNFTPGPDHAAQSAHEKQEAARRIAALPGLSWKIWIHEETGNTRGGIYLFDDLASAKAWGDDQLTPRLHEKGASDISIRYFAINEEASRITNAPLEARQAVAA